MSILLSVRNSPTMEKCWYQIRFIWVIYKNKEVAACHLQPLHQLQHQPTFQSIIQETVIFLFQIYDHTQ